MDGWMRLEREGGREGWMDKWAREGGIKGWIDGSGK